MHMTKIIGECLGKICYIRKYNVRKANENDFNYISQIKLEYIFHSCLNYRQIHGGLCAMSIMADWAEPNNPSMQSNYDARDEYLNATIGWFTQPLVTGDYPDSVRENLGDLLPSFTDEEANLIKGATDFLAIDHFTTWLVR